jgi:hypothetical protein
MASGMALRMRAELRAAVKAQGLDHATGHTRLEPLPFIKGPALKEGYAIVWGHLDHERIAIRKWGMGFSNYDLPPLYYRHQEDDGPIGVVTKMEVDAIGLRVALVTDHPLGRHCGGLSLGYEVDEFQLVDLPNRADYVHMLVTQSWIKELSLTPTPAHPKALITSRRPYVPEIRPPDPPSECALAQLYDNAIHGSTS